MRVDDFDGDGDCCLGLSMRTQWLRNSGCCRRKWWWKVGNTGHTHFYTFLPSFSPPLISSSAKYSSSRSSMARRQRDTDSQQTACDTPEQLADSALSLIDCHLHHSANVAATVVCLCFRHTHRQTAGNTCKTCPNVSCLVLSMSVVLLLIIAAVIETAVRL